jgi:hypothetical protein
MSQSRAPLIVAIVLLLLPVLYVGELFGAGHADCIAVTSQTLHVPCPYRRQTCLEMLLR